MRRIAALATLAGLCSLACATTTTRVEGRRTTRDLGTLDPAAFIIFQSSLPAEQTRLLVRLLSSETKRRGLAAQFTIVSQGNKAGIIAKATAEMPGFVLLAPSNGTPNINGVTDPVDYDVRAYHIVEHPGPAQPGSGPNGTTPLNDGKGQTSMIWRGRAYCRDWFEEQALREVVARLIGQLVADGVLPSAPQPSA